MRDGESPVFVQNPLGRLYDSMEFTLANGISDYDVRANVTGAFENLPTYTTINIRTDQNLTLKVNSDGYRAMTIVDNRPFELDNLMEIVEMYITNASGSTANIKIIGVKKRII